MNLRKGDTVVILSGKDKGKKGTIDRVLTKKQSVVVAGMNMAKRHLKPSSKYPSGGIVDMTMPLHQSKVMVVTDETETPKTKKAPTKK
jgi:large subunit ribosomal protein L24